MQNFHAQCKILWRILTVKFRTSHLHLVYLRLILPFKSIPISCDEITEIVSLAIMKCPSSVAWFARKLAVVFIQETQVMARMPRRLGKSRKFSFPKGYFHLGSAVVLERSLTGKSARNLSSLKTRGKANR